MGVEGREKGCDFGRSSFILVYSSAQPVARFACFTIYTFVSRTDDKRFPPRRDRAEGGRGGKKSALFERNEGRNRCNGPRFDAQ